MRERSFPPLWSNFGEKWHRVESNERCDAEIEDDKDLEGGAENAEL